MKKLSPLKVGLFSIALLILGFIVGLGYQSYQYAAWHQAPTTTARIAPAVRGLRVSPDDRLLAFTAIYQGFEQASRFVLDLKDTTWSAVETPAGWQDSMVQWGKDGRTILYERSKIPKLTAKAKSGLYSEKVLLGEGSPQWQGQSRISKGLSVPGEKVYAGFWTPKGQLVAKTRHDDKTLFAVKDGNMFPIDHSPGTYYQNRAIATPNGPEYYVVRDTDRSGQKLALFRIRGEKTTQLGPQFSDIIWAYLSDNAKWLLLCSNADNNQDWQWDLWKVEGDELIKTTTAQVPGDIIAVYWSPDFRHILGAVGNSLWQIEIPSLKVQQIGERNDWHADDAAWLHHENAILVAASGKLWKVDLQSGKRTEIWEFPAEYWK